MTEQQHCDYCEANEPCQCPACRPLSAEEVKKSPEHQAQMKWAREILGKAVIPSEDSALAPAKEVGSGGPKLVCAGCGTETTLFKPVCDTCTSLAGIPRSTP